MNCIIRHIRLVLLTLLAVPALSVWGQKQTIKNLPYYDYRLLHWGFCLGVSMPDVTFEHSGAPAGEGWLASCPDVNVGFMVGLMGDLAITEHLNFRCSPMLYFEERQVAFSRAIAEVTGLPEQQRTQQLKTTYLEIPVSLKVSTRRINNYRPYLVAGIQGDIDMTHEKETPIVFNYFDMRAHIGLGCDFYLPFFKLAPELRFNLGLLDMIDHDRKGIKDETLMPYTHAIQSARNKGISLIFWFE